jgi:hypothetical protein
LVMVGGVDAVVLLLLVSLFSIAAGGVYQQKFCRGVDFRVTAAVQNAACVGPVVVLAALMPLTGDEPVEGRRRSGRGRAVERHPVHDDVRPRRERLRRRSGVHAVRGYSRRRGKAVLADARPAAGYRYRCRVGGRGGGVLAQQCRLFAQALIARRASTPASSRTDWRRYWLGSQGDSRGIQRGTFRR